MPTRREVRQELYNRIPNLGFYGDLDSATTTTAVDTAQLQDGGLSNDQFTGAYIYRPAASSSADYVRRVVSFVKTTGTLTHSGANYADTTATNEYYELVGLMHPDELNACIQRALRKVYFETQAPLSLITDSDMSGSDVSSWGTVGTVGTKAKTTTAVSGVFSGIQGLNVITSAVSSGVSSSSFTVYENTQVLVSAILRVETNGTFPVTLDLMNVTADTVVRGYSTTSEGWARIWIMENVPTSCELMGVEITAASSGVQFFVDNVAAYRLGDRRMAAPSWLTEQNRFLKLREAHYGKNLADHVDDANSIYYKDWSTPRDFNLDAFRPEANTYNIQLAKPLPQTELWVGGKRAHYDINTMTDDITSTSAPTDLICAYATLEVAQILKRRFPTDPKWEVILRQAEAEAYSELRSRPETPDRVKRVDVGGRI